MAMRVVPFDSVDEVEKVHPRQGRFRFRQLATGREGSPNNFTFDWSRTFADFYSPRHRHNFDQFRIQLEGTFDFARDGKSAPGTVIYHPESAPYGPQNSSEESAVLVLQFGGASGNGYISTREQKKAIEDLENSGTFEKGVYTRTGADGKKINRDAFEAIWEHVNGRPIQYAPARYQGPIFMHPDADAWMSVEGGPGVSVKVMGVFTERRIAAGHLRLDAGASFEVAGPRLYFVLSGEGSVAGETAERYATIHLEAGDVAQLSAAAGCEILFLGLPNVEEARAVSRAA